MGLKYPQKEAEGHLTQNRRQNDGVERDLKMLALKTAMMWPQAKKHLEPPKAARGKEASSLRAFGGSTGLLTP